MKTLLFSGILLAILSGCAGSSANHVIMKHPKTGQVHDCTVTGHSNIMTGITGGLLGAAGSAYNVNECKESYQKQGFVCTSGC